MAGLQRLEYVPPSSDGLAFKYHPNLACFLSFAHHDNTPRSFLQFTAMSPWKGKARDDGYGSGDTGGIVLPLDVFTTATFESIYTLPLQVGTPPQTLSVQVDTGSSDLWIASTSCSTQACKQTSGKLYDSSKAQQTGIQFNISYVQGEVKGPIVWDTVRIGGYEIDGQALGMFACPLSRVVL